MKFLTKNFVVIFFFSYSNSKRVLNVPIKTRIQSQKTHLLNLKKNLIPIDKEVTVDLDPEDLPTDARCIGTEEQIVQNIRFSFTPHNYKGLL